MSHVISWESSLLIILYKTIPIAVGTGTWGIAAVIPKYLSLRLLQLTCHPLNYDFDVSQRLPWKLLATANIYGQMGHSHVDIYSYNRSWNRYAFTLQRSFLSEDRLTVRVMANSPSTRINTSEPVPSKVIFSVGVTTSRTIMVVTSSLPSPIASANSKQA